MGQMLLLICLTVMMTLPCAISSAEYPHVPKIGGMGFMGNDICHTTGTCQPLSAKFSFCFGVKLSYTMTSPALVNENFTQQQLHNEMSRWENLRSSPKCWAAVVPLLCSYYFPKCQDGIIDLPTQELCKSSRSKCRVIEQATKQWPEFLQCTDTSKFPSSCKNEIHDLRFPNTSKCMDPMIEVENSFNYYEGFEGCGLKCEDPFFNADDHNTASTWIWYFGITAVACNGWVVMTYVFEWMMASKFPQYPSRIMLYANAWYLIANIGWLFQYLPLGKVDIVCRKDGTVRRNEITGTENIFCGLVSSWIYFSIMSVLAELIVFSYVWNLYFSAVGRSINSAVEKRKPYFQVFAFAFPTILTVICLTVGKIDGSSMYGICFVGFYDPIPRILLVILPIGVASTVIVFNLLRTAHSLFKVTLSRPEYVSPSGVAEIKSNAYRFLVFPIGMIAILGAGLILQINSIRYQPVLDKTLQETFHCRMNLTDMAECGGSSANGKPDISTILGNIIVYFCGGILLSTWAWTSDSLSVWKRRFSSCKTEEYNEPRSHIAKHKLISKAFARRQEIPNNGRLELSLNSSLADPVGLNKLLDPRHLARNGDIELEKDYSQATGDGQDISSDWAATIPHFVQRRGALVPACSNSVSCVSDDSRRPSCDSAASEMTARHLRGSNLGLDHKSTSRRERRRFSSRYRLFNFRRSSNRGSSTSLESNPGSHSQILPAITKLIDKSEKMGDAKNFVHNNQGAKPQTKILRELAIQTSIEQLYSPVKGIKQCNLSNKLCVDQAIQCSLVKLNEAGTQTKKSATKKRDKNKDKKDCDVEVKDQGVSTQTGPDEILKFLTPNPN